MAEDRNEDAAVGETLTYEGSAPARKQPLDTGQLERGTHVQRYSILDRLGEGGMGVVYSGYDPALDRKVALKFLHEEQRSTLRQKRLIREAQVMARLRHPNVAAAYDVSTFHGRTFVSMELVDGVTLRDWLAEEPRSWQAIWPVFEAAGRGLAAAHAAGVVHRDFKPENVLVDRDGVPRVTDFGLARTVEDEDELEDDEPPSPTTVPLTQTGAVMGTPRYMAPEQHMGQPADARSDQFAFCVALYEALAGQSPFAGNTVAEIVQNVTTGTLRPPPEDRSLPRRVRQLLLRGMSIDPGDRFEDMNALLGALRPEAPSSRMRWLLAVGALLVVGGAALWTLWPGPRSGAVAVLCTGGEDRVAEVWNDGRQRALADAFEDSGAPAADQTLDKLAGGLEHRLRAWSGAHRAACEATRVRGEQSEARMDLRMTCLDRRLEEIDALIDVYEGELDPAIVKRAPGALDKLPQLSSCDDTAQLDAVTPLPADDATRVQIASLRETISRARALWVAGKYKDGRAILEPLIARAEETGYAPVRAELAYERGQHLRVLGDIDAAREQFERAAQLAAESGDGLLEANAWISLINVVSGLQARHAEAEPFAKVAAATIERISAPADVRGRYYNNLGVLRFGQSRLQEALAAFERAADLYRSSLGTDSPRYGLVRSNIGGIHTMKGAPREAIPHLAEAIAVFERALGRDHLDVAYASTSLALAMLDIGRYQEALTQFDRAYEIRVRHQGPDHAEIAYLLANRSLGLAALERTDEAVAAKRRAIAMHETTLGNEHAYAVQMIRELAGTHRRAGDLEKARAALDEALTLYAELDANEQEQAAFDAEAGELALAEGRHAIAAKRCRASLTAYIAAGRDTPAEYVAQASICAADALLGRGDPTSALETIARAETAIGERHLPPFTRARLHDARARALRKTGRPNQARDAGQAAQNALANPQGRDATLAREIADWLDALPGADE